jgi:hypothetical protein
MLLAKGIRSDEIRWFYFEFYSSIENLALREGLSSEALPLPTK